MDKLLNYLKQKYAENKHLLPSKNFSIVLGVLLGILILFLLGSYIFKYAKNKTSSSSKEKTEIKAENQTVLELLQNDTDKDGVFDWEEALWGTNKYKSATFDDVADLEYIENRKKDLKISDEKEDKTLTETDKFAREFFGAYTAMQESGQINDRTMQNFASALGQKIVYPDIPDKYTVDQVKISRIDNSEQQEEYYVKVAGLFAKYEEKGIGEELAIISSGIEASIPTDAPNAFEELTKIADAYKDFASNVMSTPTPESLADYHLRIANGAYKTGISVLNMAKVINDPIIGISGVSEYEKYSGELTDAVEKLEASFDE